MERFLHRKKMNSQSSAKVGDLVKIEGGTLRPDWYGEVGVVTDVGLQPHIPLESEWAYQISGHTWYKIALPAHGFKIIRSDMLVVLNESR